MWLITIEGCFRPNDPRATRCRRCRRCTWGHCYCVEVSSFASGLQGARAGLTGWLVLASPTRSALLLLFWCSLECLWAYRREERFAAARDQCARRLARLIRKMREWLVRFPVDGSIAGLTLECLGCTVQAPGADFSHDLDEAILKLTYLVTYGAYLEWTIKPQHIKYAPHAPCEIDLP